MCGRIVQSSGAQVYADLFGATPSAELSSADPPRPRYNLAPTQPVLAVRQSADGRRELATLRWGLVPAWSAGPDHRFSMFNARAETVDTKPAYRGPFRHRRCLIPAEGFFEWQTTPRGKTPFLIARRDRAPFALAGLWEDWHGPAGQHLASCTVIVTAANALIRPIHDRMPVILDPADQALWLAPDTRDLERLRALLRPADPTPWTLQQVSRRVNSPRQEGPDLLEPVAET